MQQQMKAWWCGIGVLISGLAAVPLGAQSAAATDVLEVIPGRCWGFVAVRNPQQFDDKVQNLLGQWSLPPTRLLESLEARLNLGPKINRDGGLAMVMMPGEPAEPAGNNAVLLFACSSVESLLGDFSAEALEPGLWRAELVWGPTFVGQKGGFAVFGTTAAATRAVLQDGAPLVQRWSGPRLEAYRSADVALWIGAGGVAAAVQSYFGEAGESDPLQVFGNALRAALRRWSGDVESALLAVDLDERRLRAAAIVEPRPGSRLAEILDFEEPAGRSWLSLLADHPLILAGGSAVSRRQMDAKVAELDAILQDPLIVQATVPDKLARFRTLLADLVRRVRGAAWGLSSRSQSPEGLATIIAVLRVDQAEGWLSDLAQAAGVLNDGLFGSPQANGYYRSVSYAAAADTVNGHRVDQLTIDLLPRSAADDPEALDYLGALGPPRKVIQLAVVDRNTIAVCVGDQPRVLFELIESAADPAIGLGKSPAVAQVQPLLPADAVLTTLVWPGELLRVARLLAQRQARVAVFPYGQIDVATPVAGTITTAGGMSRIEAVLPLDVFAALVQAHLQRRSESHPVTPPPSGN